MPASIEVLAEARTDGALLDDGQLGGQSARAQQHREVVGLLHREAAGDLARAAGDGSENARRRDHLAVEHDGERLADVGAGHLAEALAAAQVEAEVDDRLARALVEAGLRVGQVLALHHDALLDRIRAGDLPRRVELVEHVDVGRIVAGVGDEAEFELRGRAENFLEAIRVLQARHLHEDAVGALALDVRLGRAERVDAPADDFDRLVDGAAHASRTPLSVSSDLQKPVGAFANFERRRRAICQAR